MIENIVRAILLLGYHKRYGQHFSEAVQELLSLLSDGSPVDKIADAAMQVADLFDAKVSTWRRLRMIDRRCRDTIVDLLRDVDEAVTIAELVRSAA